MFSVPTTILKMLNYCSLKIDYNTNSLLGPKNVIWHLAAAYVTHPLSPCLFSSSFTCFLIFVG